MKNKSKQPARNPRPLTEQQLDAATGGGWLTAPSTLVSGFQCDGLTSQVLITCSSLTYKP